MIKVLIADDHPLIRDGLKRRIEKEVDIEMVGEASNSAEAFEFVRNNPCDVAIVDINMPGRSGLELLKDIRYLNKRIKILILSMQSEEQFAKRVIQSGASGFISKGDPPSELIEAIRKVHYGGVYVSSNLAEKLAFAISRGSEGDALEKLSDREFQILNLIGRGKSNSHIAEELALSLSSVNTYRRRILEKLNLNSTAEIIKFAIEHNLY